LTLVRFARESSEGRTEVRSRDEGTSHTFLLVFTEESQEGGLWISEGDKRRRGYEEENSL
jgi:hypothetical protein